MTKILFTVLVISMALFANAQETDGFFSSFNNEDMNRTGTSGPNLIMPTSILGSTDNNPATAPIGSGLLVLTALGAGYAISKKKNVK